MPTTFAEDKLLITAINYQDNRERDIAEKRPSYILKNSKETTVVGRKSQSNIYKTSNLLQEYSCSYFQSMDTTMMETQKLRLCFSIFAIMPFDAIDQLTWLIDGQMDVTKVPIYANIFTIQYIILNHNRSFALKYSKTSISYKQK